MVDFLMSSLRELVATEDGARDRKTPTQRGSSTALTDVIRKDAWTRGATRLAALWISRDCGERAAMSRAVLKLEWRLLGDQYAGLLRGATVVSTLS